MPITKYLHTEIVSVPDITERIIARQKHLDITVNDAITLAIEQGHDLLLVKSRLKHGEFQPWLSEHFPKHFSQARRYMQLAEASKSAHARGLNAADSIRKGLRLLAPPRLDAPQRANGRPDSVVENKESLSVKGPDGVPSVSTECEIVKEPRGCKIAANFETQIVDLEGIILQDRHHHSWEPAVADWRNNIKELLPRAGVKAILYRNGEAFVWTRLEKGDPKAFACGSFSSPPWFDEILKTITELARSRGE